jgi:cellulose synthase (UDP-forming)
LLIPQYNAKNNKYLPQRRRSVSVVSDRSKYLHTIVTSISLLLLAVFAIWWFDASHIPSNFTGPIHLIDIALFALVSYIIWHPIIMAVMSWAITSNIKTLPNLKPQNGLRVAFITNFVPGLESIELLHKTLPAMVAAHYKHDTWLLDEGSDPKVKRICEEYGVKHFSRFGLEHYNMESGKYTRKTKGGNHNAWYNSFGDGYDFVAQIDTDFVPKKNFLLHTLGHFRDPHVGFVGTPQIYGNTGDSLVARGAAEQTYNFYGPVMRGFHGMRMNMLIGANHVIRVNALKSVDHYSAHITEDLLTGMKLHAHGWTSVYIPEALAIGEAPTTWRAYFDQQMRWAYGCIHILFTQSFKLFKKMSWRQKLYYYFLQQHYFSGLTMALSTIGLMLYFAFGLQTADVDLAWFLSLYLPVLGVCGLMALWMQRYNVRPKEENGALLAGMLIGIASWPVFFLAFIGVLRGKRLTYKVTPKGQSKKTSDDSFRLFRPHLLIGSISLICLVSAFFTGRLAPIMIYWSTISAGLMLFVPFVQVAIATSGSLAAFLAHQAQSFNDRYRVFEFKAVDKSLLPSAPTDEEKYSYIERKHYFLMAFSVISFSGITVSMMRLLLANPLLWMLFGYVFLTIIYFIISFIVNASTKSFNLETHMEIVKNWRPKKYPAVDVFLPVAGESLDVLENTWQGVRKMAAHYPGTVKAYCLDDSGKSEVKQLAKQFGFIYKVRPNRGEFKKAGNLRYGFKHSRGQFIAIFDADFRPRHDFLDELVPYMQHNKKIGIVQSPQYFDVNTRQNWIERGAGAVQELFYRFSQVSRQSNDASICVGSNALYRRKALNDTGGTALIEHSEDVHTGFNLRMHGWTIQYLPIVLAKGLCPASMPAFFKQQYRWCMGSMSLLSSEKFWDTDLPFRTRLSYTSGFMYYIHTALSSFYAPIVPILLLVLMPQSIHLSATLLIVPAFIFAQFIYPIWHNSIYGVEAWAIRSIYGWAHLFAIIDAISRRSMSWQPTGAVKGRDIRYINFRVLQIIFNFIPACIWVGLAFYSMLTRDILTFAPIFISGLYYLAVAAKVTFYMTHSLTLRKQKIAQQDALIVKKAGA